MIVPETDKKPKIKSVTVWGVVAAVIGFFLTATGLSDPHAVDFLADGFQLATDIGPLLLAVGTAVTALGLRMATKPIR